MASDRSKILNPVTGRYVLKSGKIGKALLEKNKIRQTDKILNPATGRYVLKSGKIGKALLAKKSKSRKNKRRHYTDLNEYKSNKTKRFEMKEDDVLFLRTIDDDGDTKVPNNIKQNWLQQFPTARRGDILSPDLYRNEWVHIFDGEQWIPLDHDLDEYGNVPEQFSYPEFPLGYWTGIVEHNNYQWVDINSDLGRVIKNIKLPPKRCDGTNNYDYYRQLTKFPNSWVWWASRLNKRKYVINYSIENPN